MKKKTHINNLKIFSFVIILICINIFNYFYFEKNKQNNIIVTFVIQNVFNEFNSGSRLFNQIFDNKNYKNFDNIISHIKDYQFYLNEKYVIKRNIESNEHFVVFENKNLNKNSIYQSFKLLKNNYCDDFISYGEKELSLLISRLNDSIYLKEKVYRYNFDKYQELYKLINYDKISICNFRIMNIKIIDNKYDIFSYILTAFILNLILIFLILRIIKINK